jgi:hypothetical protein
MRDPTLGIVFSSKFQFSTPYAKLVEKGINPKVKDVLYNYTNATSMTRCQTGWAFRVAKEFHVITLQVFIDVYLPQDSAILDKYLYSSLFNCFGFQVNSTI